MSIIEITQIKSTIKRRKKQKSTILAIGLGKINKTIKVKNNKTMIGMIKKIKHLIKIKEIK